MNTHSHKGMTLVELIVVVAFTAVVIAAACMVLYVGSHSFQSGTSNAVNQQKVTLAESYLQQYASTAFTFSSSNGSSDGIVFELTGSVLNIRKQTVSNGSMTVKSVASIDGIARIPLRIEDGTLKYSIESEDGTYTVTGGIALNNLESGEVKDLTPEGGNILYIQ